MEEEKEDEEVVKEIFPAFWRRRWLRKDFGGKRRMLLSTPHYVDLMSPSLAIGSQRQKLSKRNVGFWGSCFGNSVLGIMFWGSCNFVSLNGG